MFCLLKINHRKENLKEKLFGNFIRDEYELKTIPVFKGAPFYELDVTVGKRGVDWQKVHFCVGKCANKLLLTESINIDEKIGIGRYKNPILYDKMMKNTFVILLKRQNKIFDDLCLIDKSAKNSDYIFNLVPYFNRISVTTDNKAKYEKNCDAILKDTGLCITTQSEIPNTQVKIDAERNIMTIQRENKIYNISDGAGFSVPDVYEKLYDNSVEKLLFYSALYEFCGVFELADLHFDAIKLNGEKKGINELIIT